METILSPGEDREILATWDVMRQLRPHLTHESYLNDVRRLMTTERFRLAALIDEGSVAAVAGYRVISLLHCGRALVVDDLVTHEDARSRGHGRRLLDWLKAEAGRQGCTELQLVSHVTRVDAHRFYHREGLSVERLEFSIRL